MRKSQLADLMGDNPIDRGVAGLPPHLSQWAARVIELPNLDSKEDRKVRHDILRCRKDKQARDRLIAVVLDQLKGDLIQRFPRLSANGRILERRFKEDAIETLKRELRAMDERDFFKPWQQIKEHLFSHLCYFFSDRKRVDIADQILVLAHLEKIEDRWDLFELKAWLLVRWQGLSCPEAAEQMEVTSESVRYFVNRWDQQFQRLFQAEKM